MTYERTKIDGSLFFDDENIEFYLSPKLPKIEFKKGKKKYYVTDLRCLNEEAINTFMDILTRVCNNKSDCDSVSYIVTDIEEEKVNLISDIVTSISCGRKIRGSESWIRFLVSGTVRHKDADIGKIITFELIKEHAQTIYEYAQKQNGVVNYWDLVVAVIEGEENRLKEMVKDGKTVSL